MSLFNVTEAWCELFGYFNCRSVPSDDMVLLWGSFTAVVGCVVGKIVTTVLD